MSELLSKALWAKCDKCAHCWAAAYYPIDMADLGRVLKNCHCPKGCKGKPLLASKPLLAKQSDGKLLELPLS